MSDEIESSKSSDYQQVSSPSVSSTPLIQPDSKKRPLSSPLEFTEAKKKILSSPENMEPEQMKSDYVSNISLKADDMKLIAQVIKSEFKKDVEETIKEIIKDSVKSIVDGVLEGVQKQLADLEEKNDNLQKENKSLREDNVKMQRRIAELEFGADNIEQYSRRNNLRISGVPELEGEDTDQIVLNLCVAEGLSLSKSDIDRSHRVGKPGGAKVRQIIVKFTSYRARRQMYKSRQKLKVSHNKVYINEDLTRHRNKILYEARQLVKRSAIDSAWSSDGVILIKDRYGEVKRVEKIEDLPSSL